MVFREIFSGLLRFLTVFKDSIVKNSPSEDEFNIPKNLSFFPWKPHNFKTLWRLWPKFVIPKILILIVPSNWNHSFVSPPISKPGSPTKLTFNFFLRSFCFSEISFRESVTICKIHRKIISGVFEIEF